MPSQALLSFERKGNYWELIISQCELPVYCWLTKMLSRIPKTCWKGERTTFSGFEEITALYIHSHVWTIPASAVFFNAIIVMYSHRSTVRLVYLDMSLELDIDLTTRVGIVQVLETDKFNALTPSVSLSFNWILLSFPQNLIIPQIKLNHSSVRTL